MQACASMTRGGMMEFEFSENDGGQFRGTGKVVHFITGHLGRGEIDLAVGLYESSVGNIGDTLLAELAPWKPLDRTPRTLERLPRGRARWTPSAARCARHC